jgi:adenylate cyclase
LSQDQCEALWEATAGRRLEKTRYTLDWEGQTIELDVYHGALAGLMVAAVEFPSASASARFTPPRGLARK